MFCYGMLGQRAATTQQPTIDPTLLKNIGPVQQPAEKKDDGPSVLTLWVGGAAIGLALWALSS